MKLRALKVKGLTRYTTAAVDFAALGEGLVAIAGANGEGKTSILEAPCGALHLELPSYPGPLHASMSGKASQLDLELEHGGRSYRALVAVDAIGRTTEAHLYQDGEPVTTGKVRDYQAAIAQRFGSLRLFLAACLSAQKKSGAFLTLTKAERKDLLAEILDTSGLQQLSEAARESARKADSEAVSAASRRQLLEAEVAQLERKLSAAEDVKDGLSLASLELLEASAASRAAVEALAVAKADQESRAVRLREHGAALAACAGRKAAAAARLVSAKGARAKLELERAGRVSQLRGMIAEAQQLALGVDGLKAHSERAGVLELRAAELRGLVDAHAAAERSLEGEALRLRAQAQAAERLEERLSVARKSSALLGGVPCRGELPGCAFLSAAEAARVRLPDMERELEEASVGLLSLHDANCALEASRQEGSRLRGELRRVEEEAAEARGLASRLPEALVASQRADGLAESMAEFEQAYGQRSLELAQQEEAEAGALAAEEAELARLAASAPDLGPEPDVRGLTIAAQAASQREEAARAELSRLQALQAVIEDATGRLQDSRAKLEACLEEHAAAVQAVSEWELLEKALGRDGIQALEIDAAGPELSQLTTDLLGACFGPRFELRFITQLPKADGKGQKEVFDVLVSDRERGREGSADRFSGGEGTVLSEAISLALAIYVGRHSGREFRTLFRDETAGQLDPENARRYVAMLRRARVLGGFHQVVYIAQQPEVWRSADAVLWCQGGSVSVLESAGAA